MILDSPYTVLISNLITDAELKKGNWIAILHAKRIPPHIGLIINGYYNSLTIKGHELDIDVAVLLKTMQQKKIETIFVKLIQHPVFSVDYQKEVCQLYIKQFKYVKQNQATCLSPIKLFLQEFYALKLNENELLFELVERLKQNNYIETSYGLNIECSLTQNSFTLPMYTNQQLQLEIEKVRSNNSND